jgi:ATP-dependent Clp protease ATP-binding subunit ClpX
LAAMNEFSEKIPDPKEIEKELSDFLTKKFGGAVKLAPPIVIPQEAVLEKPDKPRKAGKPIEFDLKPEDLIAYLDQYIIKQDDAKAILATKICTHFNRIRHFQTSPEVINEMVGRIKNNVLMIGPTGVGKTYMVRLIAQKIGVPFVKGDATKFSETGYVGGDVEDLVRDLVREADGDIERAQYGIIYIDEIDKIASSHNLIGADVSRTGVQRALLKPLEETDVDLKVPHDPISMIQEIERFRRTGKREKNSVNTRNVLFIVSGAFTELDKIIKKRITDQGIGFGAHIGPKEKAADLLKQVKSEDLINFGFESEFVGRLPVKAVFERLEEEDLYEILKNPSNPIILGKKIDFSAYGIAVKFDDSALRILAKRAFNENTGARGLVSAVEEALLCFEKTLPSSSVKLFPVTAEVVEKSKAALEKLLDKASNREIRESFQALCSAEKRSVAEYLRANQVRIAEKYGLPLNPARIDIIAETYVTNVIDIEKALKKIKGYYDETKTIEFHFLKNFGINLVLEDDAIDHIIEKFSSASDSADDIYKQLAADFEYGLKLVRDKTGRNRFFVTRDALINPENYISNLLKQDIRPHRLEVE